MAFRFEKKESNAFNELKVVFLVLANLFCNYIKWTRIPNSISTSKYDYKVILNGGDNLLSVFGEYFV